MNAVMTKALNPSRAAIEQHATVRILSFGLALGTSTMSLAWLIPTLYG